MKFVSRVANLVFAHADPQRDIEHSSPNHAN